MKQKSGLWIDHRKAVIVNIYDSKIEKMLIESSVERQPGRINGARSMTPFERQMVLADDLREQIFKDHIKKFYNKICSKIKDAEALLILGPGEAKIEFRKFIEKSFPAKIKIATGPADRMTDPQITARILTYFKIKKRPVTEL